MSKNLTDISKTKDIVASVLAFIGVVIIVCVSLVLSPLVIGSYVIYNIFQEARHPDDMEHEPGKITPRKGVAVTH